MSASTQTPHRTKNVYLYISIVTLLLLSSCQDKRTTIIERKDDSAAKAMLQGNWLDAESARVQYRNKGEPIYFTDASYNSRYFKIINDTLVLYGTNDSTFYKIDKKEADSFWYHSLTDEIVKLHRSENELDSLDFETSNNTVPAPEPEVIQKDAVVMYNGHRYRGYVYINPSQMKVIRTLYTETGMSVENVYYDNVIHICVYEGTERLYSKDFYKKDFADLIPEDFLRQAILADMDFIRVSAEGYEYLATLCIPDEASCYNIDIKISHNGGLSLENSTYP